MESRPAGRGPAYVTFEGLSIQKGIPPLETANLKVNNLAEVLMYERDPPGHASEIQGS